MVSINGYKYSTEPEAIIAREACDQYYGIPKSPDDITQNWVEYYFAELNDPQFWYIVYDQSLEPILGSPQQFNLVQSPFPN